MGAHRGVFSGYAAKKSGNKIIAIEPDATNFKYLEEFVHRNQLTNVDVRNIAVGPSDGTIKIYKSESSRHSITGVDQATGQLLQDYVQVPCTSLNTLLSEFEQVDFLKLDCEGCEYITMDAIIPLALDKITKLSVEIHNIDKNRTSVNTLMSKINKAFEVVNLSGKSKNLAIVHAKKALFESNNL